MPWARLALAVWLGLGLGAMFIPIVDEPDVALPMWSIGAIALALIAASAPLQGITQRHSLADVTRHPVDGIVT
jgi:hypothetical protein